MSLFITYYSKNEKFVHHHGNKMWHKYDMQAHVYNLRPVGYRNFCMLCFTLAGFVLHRLAMPWVTDNSIPTIPHYPCLWINLTRHHPLLAYSLLPHSIFNSKLSVCLFVLCLSCPRDKVTFQMVAKLDSETGWTAELWLKTNP